jgi:hypothetical protein
MIAPQRLYLSHPEYLVLIFDLREPEACEQVHYLRAVWQADSDLEALGPDHMVVILFPGTDGRMAA